MAKLPEKAYIPEGYRSELGVRETEKAIKEIKDYFQESLAHKLNLQRVSAPLFVDRESGLNDNLNGIERPVSFDIGEDRNGHTYEIVQSLAKWKRLALKRYGFEHGEGLYTDMNAIRRDEETDNIHSLYVDQWDWEKVISREERTLDLLMNTARKIYSVMKSTEHHVLMKYGFEDLLLNPVLSYVTTQELEDMYPDLTSSQREDAYVREHGSAFIMKIGGKLRSGEIHDGRAPDYDDWELNGDLVVYNPILDIAFELSSMGIRVDAETMKKQLEIRGCEDRASLPFHSMVLNDELPLTMGGGIGQSRLCMFFLRKAHIGEVQASVWTEDTKKTCADAGVELL